MLDKKRLASLTSYIERLQTTAKPIFIYGMGDGCLKVLKIFEEYNIPCAGIFASDEFVRDKIFCGHHIHKLSDIEAAVDDFICVLAFGAGYRELIDKIDLLNSRHELIVPDMPVIGDGLFTQEYMLNHFDELESVYDMLCDEQSKRVFENVVTFKITGDIGLLKECETPVGEAYDNILRPNMNEIYVDLGAYTGDTVRELLEHTDDKYAEIYAVEPNKRNFRKLSEYAEGMLNVTLINAAVWNEETELIFSKGGGRMPHLSDRGIVTPAVSVDSVLDGKACTYIKMDVEGAEARAIDGAKDTLIKYMPKLNVALYHRTEDIFALPLMIKCLCPEYKFYMRHFPYYPAWDTNLYAVKE